MECELECVYTWSIGCLLVKSRLLNRDLLLSVLRFSSVFGRLSPGIMALCQAETEDAERAALLFIDGPKPTA